ncbi:hypothetical protein FKP32DRAFT_6536 [Trametes sanguinea]|nr:hypothetical protein FKP32DRAFT_6536 [Trametes sanguinea]
MTCHSLANAQCFYRRFPLGSPSGRPRLPITLCPSTPPPHTQTQLVRLAPRLSRVTSPECFPVKLSSE